MSLNPAGVPSMDAINKAIAAKQSSASWSGDVAPGITSRAVSYDKPFPPGVTPRLGLGLRDVNMDWITATAASVTNTGCNITIRNGFGSALYATVDIIAIAP